MKKTDELRFNAFDPALFCENAELAISLLEKYLEDQRPQGLQMVDPYLLEKKARSLMVEPSEATPIFDSDRFKEIIELYLRTGIHVYTAGSMGRQFSGVVPLAGVTDLVNSIVNQPSSFYEAAQLPNVAEHIMADELNRFIGFDKDEFTMVTTSGGSLANLTALLAARNNRFADVWKKGMAACQNEGVPAIAVSEDAHYSMTRAAGTLGIGENQMVRLPVDKQRRIDTGKAQVVLDRARAKGLNVFCLIASAGTTPVGAIDPLDELADIAEANGLWLHVDGCHGASLLVSDLHRAKLKGIQRADSLTWDAHKLMFVPSPCSLLFYKEKQKAYKAFHQEASYVFDKVPGICRDFNGSEKNYECTKRPTIMNLWILWAVYGRTLFADKVDYACQLCSDAYLLLRQMPDFETIHSPDTNILCFRYRPDNLPAGMPGDFQLEIRDRLSSEGTYFISKVEIDGETALRMVFMQQRTSLEHVKELLDKIRGLGQLIITNYHVLNN